MSLEHLRDRLVRKLSPSSLCEPSLRGLSPSLREGSTCPGAVERGQSGSDLLLDLVANCLVAYCLVAY